MSNTTDEKKRRDDDLRKRLDHLYSMQVQPSLYLARRFDELRNEVDLNAEKAMAFIKPSTSEDDGDEDYKPMSRYQINDARLEFIRILGAVEQKIRNQLSTKSALASEAYSHMEKRVFEFM